MRKDITKNLFWWFRGPSDKGGIGAHRQLENNLTKSLVSVLDHCNRGVVLRAFLKTLGLALSKNVVFSLQRRPFLAGASKKRIVLGITVGPAELVEKDGGAEAGRPDAWVCGGNWTVLIENKIGSKLSTAQLASHAIAAGWAKGTFKTCMTSWTELHRLFRECLPFLPQKDHVSGLLLQEWLSYLEHQNMTEFEQLDAIDFDFFALPEDERRALLPRMKTRIRGLARMLDEAAIARKIASLYTKSKVRDWKIGEHASKGRGGWLNIGGDPSPRTWHATVFIRVDGLAIEVLSTTTGLARKLCKSGVDLFRDILDLAGKNDSLSVVCRRAWYRDPASSYKGQHIERCDEPLIVTPATLSGMERDSFAVLLRAMLAKLQKDKRWRTELHVREEIPRGELLGKPASQQIKRMAKALQPLHEILALLLAAHK